MQLSLSGGLNNLSAEASLVKEFFEGLQKNLSPADLEDAAVLLTYCATTARQGHFNIEMSILAQWAGTLVDLLDSAIHNAPGPNSRCALLLSRAQACLIPVEGDKYTAKPDELLNYWQQLLDVVPDAPLFPLAHFADIVTKVTPFIVNDPRFARLTDRLNRLLEQRTGGFVAAGKCLDRANALFAQERFIPALKQVQQAKIKWFAAETLPKALIAMLLASECYEHLKLYYAAKYYASGVLFVLFGEKNQNLKRFLPQAAFEVFRACYGSGSCLWAMEVLHLALLFQQNYSSDPFDYEKHPALKAQIAQICILRSVTRRLAPYLLPILDQMGAEWALSENLWADVTEISQPDARPWSELPREEIWRKIEYEIGVPFFNELGPIRHISWSALGIVWTVCFQNNYELNLLEEEIAATLQILQADLAAVDLCLFPTAADIEIELTDGEHHTCEERPDNSRASWLIRIPRNWLSPTTSTSGEEISSLTLAATILGQCTALPFERFMRVLESAFEEGLATKAFSIRPARELFAKIHSKENFLKSERTEMQAPPMPEWFKVVPAGELKWCDKEGPGYSKQESEAFIRNRYENALRPIRLTLPRLMTIPRIVSILRAAQEDLPDWQILNVIASIVVNFRIRNEIGSTGDVRLMQENLMKWMFRDEEKEDPEFPVDLFTTEEFNTGTNVALLSNLKTWGLTCNLRTPDFSAIRRFLDARYHNSSDDVPHESPFC